MMLIFILLFLIQKTSSAMFLPPPIAFSPSPSRIINSSSPNHQRQYSLTALLNSPNRRNSSPSISSRNSSERRLSSGSNSGTPSRAISSPNHQRRNSWTAFLDSPRRSISRVFSRNSSKNIQLQSGPKSGELDTLHEFTPQHSFTPSKRIPSSSSSRHHRRRYSLPASPLGQIKRDPSSSGTKSVEVVKFHGPKPFAILRSSLWSNKTKKAVPNCDCDYRNRRRMKDFIFKSDISSKELTVKVAIDEGNFAGGKWAKLFNGCFQQKREWKCVGVKLVGRGTIQNPTDFEKRMPDEDLFDDPKKEINNLKMIKETYTKKDQRKHVIKLYDGGEIFYLNEEDHKKYEHEYKYAIILELGGNNYLDTFIKTFINNKSKTDEEKLMKFMAKGIEPFIEIHKILIHMDLKPQNMIYVPENGGIFGGKNKVLKVIDFGGAHFFQQNQLLNDPSINRKNGKDPIHIKGIQMKNKKVTSTVYIMPPEMDQKHHFYMHYNDNEEDDDDDIVEMDFNPTATTKSDMWEFGMLIYNLLLVHEYPEKSQKEIISILDAINKIYQFGNEVENFEDIHKFIVMVYPPIKKEAEILAYAFILNIRSKYPWIFVLVTNLLDKNQKERLSASGAFHYLLKMECKIKIEAEKEEEFVHKFIGKITIKMLENSKYLAKMAEKYNIKLELNDENIKKTTDKFNRIEKICDQSYSPAEQISQHSSPIFV